LVAVWFIEAARASTDFFPRLVEWNTSIPQIIAGLVMSGRLSTAQGIPPILALIYMRILFTMDLRFLPFEMVPVSTAWLGTGTSVKRNFLTSSYVKHFPFYPGSSKTTAYTLLLSLLCSSRFHESG
jgi:hypothetical protein